MSSGNEESLHFAMDRGAIWKAALTLLKEGGVEYTPCDVTELAKFLAGDDIPYPIQEMSSTGEQQAEGSTEGTE